MNPQNSDALKLFKEAFNAVEIIDRYKPLSITGKFEALLFNSLLTLSTYQKKCNTAQDYSKTEEEFMQLVVMVAKEHNLLRKIDDLASFINNRMSFYDEELYNLTSDSNYIPGRIYDAFYINPLAIQPQMNNDLSVILIFQQSLIKVVSEVENAKVWSNFPASDKSNNPLEKGKIDQKPREEFKTSTSKKLVEKVESLNQFFQIIKSNFTIDNSEIEVLKNSSSDFEFKFSAYREDKFWGNCIVSFKESLSFKIDSHTNKKIINHHYRLLLKLKNEEGFEFHSQAKPFKKEDPLNTFLLLFQILFEDLEKQDDGLPF